VPNPSVNAKYLTIHSPDESEMPRAQAENAHRRRPLLNSAASSPSACGKLTVSNSTKPQGEMTMRKIAALNVLLRMRVLLPDGLKVTTEEFGAGWNLMQAGDMARLEEEIQAHGWNFIKIDQEPLRSGVGKTPEEAISTALKLLVTIV
jgi:hypothetical protein